MTAKFLLGLALATATAAGAAAQSAPVEPPPSPPGTPPTAYPYRPDGYGYDDPYDQNTHLALAISFPYAFNFDAPGISGELGGVWDHNFFGGEVTYFGGDERRYDVVDDTGAEIGHFHSAEDITTVEFAYRYLIPLGGNGGPSPVIFYIGGGGGVGWVHYTNNGSEFGFNTDNNGEPAEEGVAGFQFRAGRGLSVRIGYRYVVINRVLQFDHRSALESSVLEAGLVFRF